jgi:hypothetical protein
MENDCKVAAKPKNVKEFIKSRIFWRPFLGVLTGGLAGFLYYHFVGCSTGSCPITSHSYTIIPFGAVMGYLITSGPCKKC